MLFTCSPNKLSNQCPLEEFLMKSPRRLRTADDRQGKSIPTRHQQPPPSGNRHPNVVGQTTPNQTSTPKPVTRLPPCSTTHYSLARSSPVPTGQQHKSLDTRDQGKKASWLERGEMCATAAASARTQLVRVSLRRAPFARRPASSVCESRALRSTCGAR